MNMKELIISHGFVQSDNNEYVRDNWTIRLEFPQFEIFSDPEIDTRYYYGYLSNLEKYLNAID